jgi:Trk K+ transport system NAD-binding subunit
MNPAPVLLVGDDGVPLRVREELEAVGVPVVAICSAPDTLGAQAAAASGARVVIGSPTASETWDEAGLESAQAVGLLRPDDLANLNAALLIAERDEHVRIVVRLYQADLNGGVERMLGGRGTALSDTEVAAPAFLQAALSGNEGQTVALGGRVLEVAEVDRDDPSLVVALADPGTPTDVFPPPAALDGRVLGLVDRQGVVSGTRGALPVSVATRRRARRQHAPWRSRMRGRLRLIERRVWILLALIGSTFAVGTSVFAISKHLDVIDSMYFTATTMATVGYGDVNLLKAPDWLKLFDIGLMAVSAVLLASVLAMITDLLVRSRIDRALGRFPRPRADHVIVCGLGRAGAAILAGLRELEVPCIGVDHNEDAVGIAVARQLEVPVVFADARTPGTLEQLHLSGARALMAVTNDDLANLQTALTAREHNPQLRVVLRIFDAHLAERLDRSVELDLTRSVPGLAAPAFTAALLGRPLATALALSNVPLRVVDTVVPADWASIGVPIGEINRGRALRVLALDGRWRPRHDLAPEAGMTISVVGTREACDALLR